MKPIVLRGMTWDHRRAVQPLLAADRLFNERRPDVAIEWHRRPLAGFEFTPVASLAETYDLIVFDHPFIGAVAASESLVPVDDIVAPHGAAFVGSSLASYRMIERIWAVPIDAATQVQALRPDLLARLDAEVPRSWDEVMDVARRAESKGLKLAIGLRGVHSLMAFFALSANLGAPCAVDPGADFCDRAVARQAIGRLRELLAWCAPESLDWNAIEVLDAMVARDDLVLCPSVYFYATYAEADQRRPLRFHDFPGPNGPMGTTLGGAGLGISARSSNVEAACDYARHAAEAATQFVFARHHGQPARVEGWEDAAINAVFADSYRNTRATHEAAWVRPRYNGYLRFQKEAGDRVEQALRSGEPADALIDALEVLSRDCPVP